MKVVFEISLRLPAGATAKRDTEDRQRVVFEGLTVADLTVWRDELDRMIRSVEQPRWEDL